MNEEKCKCSQCGREVDIRQTAHATWAECPNCGLCECVEIDGEEV